MPTRVALEYPNGRVHETTVQGDLKPGAEFVLYGRRWRVEPPGVDRWGHELAKAGPLVCRSLDAGSAAPAAAAARRSPAEG